MFVFEKKQELDASNGVCPTVVVSTSVPHINHGAEEPPATHAVAEERDVDMWRQGHLGGSGGGSAQRPQRVRVPAGCKVRDGDAVEVVSSMYVRLRVCDRRTCKTWMTCMCLMDQHNNLSLKHPRGGTREFWLQVLWGCWSLTGGALRNMHASHLTRSTSC